MPIIDAHAFFGAPPESVRKGTIEEVEGVLGQAKVNAVILAGAMCETGDFVRGNEQLGKAAEGHYGVYAYVSVNPSYPDESIEELRKRLTREPWKALKLPRGAAGPRIASEGLRAILHAAIRFGMPVLVDTDTRSGRAGRVDAVGRVPVPQVCARGHGRPGLGDGDPACEPNLNCYLELGSLCADRDKLGDAVRAVSARRVLFGSHFPRCTRCTCWA